MNAVSESAGAGWVQGTLYGRLVLMFLLVFVVLSGLLLAVIVFSTRYHVRTVEQSLHRDLASEILNLTGLTSTGEVSGPDAERIFHEVMVINPAIEVYLLDNQGSVLHYSAPSESIKRDRVATAPIRAFVDGNRALPIVGDDPKDSDARKVFSAAPYFHDGRTVGYLYAILEGEKQDTVRKLWEGDYVLRIGLVLAACGAALIVLIGIVSFQLLTRRLRNLANNMQHFRDSGFQPPTAPLPVVTGHREDEVDQVARVFDDMTRQIASQIAQLDAAERLRMEMVENYLHDLKTPLTTLQGYLEALDRDSEHPATQERARYIKNALSFTRRLSRLSTDLFYLVRLDAEREMLRAEPFPFNELVSDICQGFETVAARKHIALRTDIARTAPRLSGDIGLLERAVSNVIDNAIRYTSDGGHVTVSLTYGSDAALVTVKDDGCGIAPDDVDRVFGRFVRLERVDAQPGSGLGLSITQRVIELHGGRITVRSRLGSGTVVSMTIPLSAQP